MQYIKDFFHQKAPQPGREMPDYFRRGLIASEVILAVYFLLITALIASINLSYVTPPLLMFAAAIACLPAVSRVNMRVNLGLFTLVLLVWSEWFVIAFGWHCGGQSFVLPLLMISFFNIYASPWRKVLNFAGIMLARLLMFFYSLTFPPRFAIQSGMLVAFQILNSLAVFLMLACLCVVFSTSVQATERKLRLNNQELHREAGTDPLTQLPNRRSMMNLIEMYRRNNPEEYFCIAIADIDFFKKVNDTYGHNGGDYTLRELSALFKNMEGEDYRVCRWGGEEFCFFLPGKNLDDAGNVMFTLGSAVRRMPLSFEGADFNITVTIGVAENDFQSSMEEILNQADQKLYLGKVGGRDRVVV